MKDKITINCHSSIKIADNKIIYFDPYKIEETTNDADYIFITHDHYDHYDIDSIKKIMNNNTKIIFPDSMAPKILGQIPANQLTGVIPNETYKIDDLDVETIPSYNPNKEFHPRKNNWVGYIITLNGERIYVAGDTDITPEIQNVKCDIALIPIGGTYTMTPLEAAELINTIQPRTVIPTHYACIVGTYEDGEIFKKQLNSNIECLLLIKEDK